MVSDHFTSSQMQSPGKYDCGATRDYHIQYYLYSVLLYYKDKLVPCSLNCMPLCDTQEMSCLDIKVFCPTGGAGLPWGVFPGGVTLPLPPLYDADGWDPTEEGGWRDEGLHLGRPIRSQEDLQVSIEVTPAVLFFMSFLKKWSCYCRILLVYFEDSFIPSPILYPLNHIILG